jgi:hypothetical protein
MHICTLHTVSILSNNTYRGRSIQNLVYILHFLQPSLILYKFLAQNNYWTLLSWQYTHLQKAIYKRLWSIVQIFKPYKGKTKFAKFCNRIQKRQSMSAHNYNCLGGRKLEDITSSWIQILHPTYKQVLQKKQ